MSRKMILEANSSQGIDHKGRLVTRHSITIDNEVLRELSEEEVKELLYKWIVGEVIVPGNKYPNSPLTEYAEDMDCNIELMLHKIRKNNEI